MTNCPVDLYYYARDHDAGPGAWCVYGPDGFKISVHNKDVAYIIGKLLSRKYAEAKSMLDDLVLSLGQPTPNRPL